jgi:transposase
VLWEYRVVEQRYDAVMEVLGEGRTVTEVAERWGVSRQSLYSWLGRYHAGGLEGLADRSHRPRRYPQQIPVAVEVRICELRRRHPDWGPRRLAHELGRDGLEPVPSRSAIYRTLVRQRLIEPVARRRRRAEYRRWERDRPMELWQLDVMGGVWLADGAAGPRARLRCASQRWSRRHRGRLVGDDQVLRPGRPQPGHAPVGQPL